MAFKSIVTRRNKEAEVVLEAKVVVPKKYNQDGTESSVRKSKRVQYPIKIKPNGLSDLECCIIDRASIKNELELLNLTNLKSDVPNLKYNGVNGTTISYTFEGSNITDYLNDDGTLKKRPSIESGDAIGTINILVSKNEASADAKIAIAIPAYTAEEVFEICKTDDCKNALWNEIRGENPNAMSKGWQNISKNLAFGTSISPATLGLQKYTNQDINTSWTVIHSVTDGTLQSCLNTGGNVSLITFDKMCDKLSSSDRKYISYKTVNDISNTNSLEGAYYKIGGITLKCTITIGSKSSVVEISNCEVQSAAITNKEVGDNVLNEQIMFIDESDNKYLFKEYKVSDFVITKQRSDGAYGTYKLKLLNTALAQTSIKYDKYNIDGVSSQVAATFTNSVLKHGEQEAYTPSSVFTISTDSSTPTGNEVTINLDAMAAQALEHPEAVQFTIRTEFSVSKYGGETATSYKDANFKIVLSA